MKYKNWVKLELIDLPKFGGGGLSPTPALSYALSSLIIEKTWLKLVMLENLQACFLKLHFASLYSEIKKKIGRNS